MQGENAKNVMPYIGMKQITPTVYALQYSKLAGKIKLRNIILNQLN